MIMKKNNHISGTERLQRHETRLYNQSKVYHMECRCYY